MSKDNSAGSPVEQNVETEWLQWLDIHSVGPNNVTDSNELKYVHTLSLSLSLFLSLINPPISCP